ncbi:MAG: hypothetical protein ACREEX_10425, partial [Caulobacteraceae bacterium]
HTDADPDGDVDPDAYAHSNADGDGVPHADADPHTDGDGDGDPDAHTDSHPDPDADTDADGDGHSDPDAYADSDARPDRAERRNRGENSGAHQVWRLGSDAPDSDSRRRRVRRLDEFTWSSIAPGVADVDPDPDAHADAPHGEVPSAERDGVQLGHRGLWRVHLRRERFPNAFDLPQTGAGPDGNSSSGPVLTFSLAIRAAAGGTSIPTARQAISPLTQIEKFQIAIPRGVSIF